MVAVVVSVVASACRVPCPEVAGEGLRPSHWRLPGDAVRSYQGEMGLERVGRRHARATVWLWVQEPNKLRLDVLSPFGPALSFATDGRTLAYHNHRERTWTTGLACAGNLGKLLGLDLDARAAVTLLRGRPPLPIGAPTSTACNRRGEHELRFADDAVEDRITVRFVSDKRGMRAEILRAEHRSTKGKRGWIFEAGGYRGDALHGLALPTLFRFENTATGNSLRLQTLDLRVNAQPPQGAFILAKPAGVSERKLEACADSASSDEIGLVKPIGETH